MADTIDKPEKKKKKHATAPLYGLKPAVVHAIVEAARAGQAKRVRRLIHPLHHSDIADLLERLPSDVRFRVVDFSRRTLPSEVLPELDDAVRDEVLDILEPRQVAAAVSDLSTDDAVEILEDLDHATRQKILTAVEPEDRLLIEDSLSYPDDSAGRLMQRDSVAVAQSWTVGEVIDHMRESADLPDDFYDIFVVDSGSRALVGSLPLNKLLRTRRAVRIAAMMDRDITIIPATMDQEDVAILFRDRDLVSAPVVDDDNRLVGMITVDDVVDVIDEEAEEDLLKLSGVSETDFYQDMIQTTRRRFSWLGINLVTAIAASIVIAIFARTIEQVVALAVLMPIVASMGGIAGTQTLTVAVRAIAMRDFGPGKASRFILKELSVGLANGILFAAIMGVIAGLWFADRGLGLVIAVAMVLNLLVAGLSGAMVPFLLDRRGVDPAIASPVILTTVTDVIGFLTFLGLATVFLL
ncbi:MAG: magnesium transporter [Rhodospirillaceae bacterium]|nr:magnesium transporter [Rhodospirillaceae bacterium]MDE0616292.1 magnesium transporter [Rhodospirillaceae bacterium]